MTTACGSGTSSSSGSTAAAAADESGDGIFSAQKLDLTDGSGNDLSSLSYSALRLVGDRVYALGMDYYDTGSCQLLRFDADGGNLEIGYYMGVTIDDLMASCIGSDGNFYFARTAMGIEYGVNEGVSTVSEAQEPLGESEEEITEETEEIQEGPADGSSSEDAGETEPASGDETGDADADSPYGAENAQVFTASGGPGEEYGDSSSNGITSPEDEYGDEQGDADAEEELMSGAGSTQSAAAQEVEYVLTCVNANGEEIWNAEITPAQTQEDGSFYVTAVAETDEGILLADTAGLELYDKEDGSLIRTVLSDENIWSSTLYVLQDGTVVLMAYGESGNPEFDTLDLETGALETVYTFTSSDYVMGAFPGTTYDLYLSGDNAVYGLQLNGTDPVKVIDYVNSDMDITGINCLAELSDGSYVVALTDADGNSEVDLLRAVDASTLANRTVITLGCYYLDYNVREQIFAYNKSHDDTRIQILDYSQYDSDDDSAGLTRLNTDIASGSAPDIICLSSSMPIESYISKGIFEDLTPYFEGDEEISQSEYLTNVLDAFKTDGEMYTVVPSFYAVSVIGKTEDIGDGSAFTIDLVEQLVEQKGVDPSRSFGITTRDTILYEAIELCGSQFVDWENSSCSFNSDDFIRLLEFVNQFPAQISENMEEDNSADYRKGLSLFYEDSIGTFDEYMYLRYGVYGTEITLAGFPSTQPTSAAIAPSLQMAVSSTSENKDACWNFLREFYLDAYQSEITDYWPVSASALWNLAVTAQTPIYYTDENGQQAEDHIVIDIGGEEIELPRTSQEEAEQVIHFLQGLDSTIYYDGDVENIIVEEAAAYFEGQKSAEDVADIIQSRVQIYINENS